MARNEIILDDLVELINHHGGIDALGEAIGTLMNAAMRIERAEVLNAEPYQRTEQRRGHANGFKPKTVHSRLGDIPLKVPQVRGEVSFYPSALTKGPQTERALNLAVAEMYIQGVSTRRVEPILQQLVGHGISSSTVSKAAAELDQVLAAWRDRPLDGQAAPYLILDARYEKARINGIVRDVAVLIAIGVLADGHRSVLGLSISLSEAEVHWRDFLQSLMQRGLHGVELITSDDHPGLKAARKAVLGSVPWQRCQFHLQQNAQAYVPTRDMQAEVAETIRDVFNAPNQDKAAERLDAAVDLYRDSAPKLSRWMAENLPEGLNVFAIPKTHQRYMRTSNWLENLNGKIKKRTSVIGLFPNTDSILRLVSAMLRETDERWLTGKRYLNMNRKND
ncbi:MAG: IS256 family transposase [Pirellulaceae bacterium]|nr:IS256 family transposase [Pirellulaceae bacterium]